MRAHLTVCVFFCGEGNVSSPYFTQYIFQRTIDYILTAKYLTLNSACYLLEFE